MILKIIKKIIIAMILFGIGLVGFFYGAYYLVDFDEYKKQLQRPQKISSEILDRNGKRIAYIFEKGKHRLYANFDEIPPLIIEALIATEDTSFFEHKGINPDSILRAIIADIKAGRFVEGGSTLTQQLVKNISLSRKKSISRKLKEIIIAIKADRNFSKEEIIEKYLNEIPYGNNYYGIKTAAQGYFHKDLNQLTLKEIAMLIGLPNAPSYYNPLRHYERIFKRANKILFRLKTLGWISKAQYQEAIKERPKVYKTTLTQNQAPYVVDEVIRRFRKKIPDIKTGGYKIYTTIDLNLQKKAREALTKGYIQAIKRFKPGKKHSKLNGALVAVKNNTGEILAMVGGISHKQSPYNRATRAKRQIGSTFKPFIYQIALDMGYNPASYLNDVPRTFSYIKNGRRFFWSPKNYERNYKGPIPLRESLVHSRNVATINLVCDLGNSISGSGGDSECMEGINILRKQLLSLGIDKKRIPNNLSLALGNLSLSPLEVAQMYTIFPNKGDMVQTHLVNKVLSPDNVILYETQIQKKHFTNPEQAFLMTTILKDVIRRGTGKRAKVKGIELAGKTGTTNKYVDAWFSGYSPEVTTVVWFGRDNNTPIGKGATGGMVSAPVFKNFFESFLKIYKNTKRKFEMPKGVYIGYYNGKREYYTKYSPLPTELLGDEFAYHRPKLHPINQLAPATVSDNADDSYGVDEIQDDIKVPNSKKQKTQPYGFDDILKESQTQSSNLKKPSLNGDFGVPIRRSKTSHTQDQLDDSFVDFNRKRVKNKTEDEFLERDSTPPRNHGRRLKNPEPPINFGSDSYDDSEYPSDDPDVIDYY